MDVAEGPIRFAQFYPLGLEDFSRDKSRPAQAAFPRAAGCGQNNSCSLEGIHERFGRPGGNRFFSFIADMKIPIPRYFGRPSRLCRHIFRRPENLGADFSPRNPERFKFLQTKRIHGLRPAQKKSLGGNVPDPIFDQFASDKTRQSPITRGKDRK